MQGTQLTGDSVGKAVLNVITKQAEQGGKMCFSMASAAVTASRFLLELLPENLAYPSWREDRAVNQVGQQLK